MDLQTILAASDEDDSSDLDPTISFRYTSDSNNVELEQILREDEDDEDDLDDDMLERQQQPPPRSLANANATATPCTWEVQKRILTPSADSLSDEYATSSSQQTKESPTTTSSHNAEDWAVLQAILREDEDKDNDEDDDDDNEAWMEPQHEALRQMHVDDMVRSNTDLLQPKRFTSPPRTATTTMTMTENSKQRLNGSPNSPSAWNDVPRQQQQQQQQLTPNSKTTLLQQHRQQQQRNIPFQDDDRELSQRALQSAIANERKLLKASTAAGEIVSPLMVKRRLKPKVELAARGYKQRQLSPAERLTASTLPRFQFSGIVDHKPMANISQSIDNHALHHTKFQTGWPTCFAFNSKFIAVGTQLGFVLVYDLFEVLRQRLSTSALWDEATSKKPGSITSIDLSHNGEVVVSGYASGLLLLWDTIRGTLLRAVTDLHPSPITSVRCLTDLKLVTVDAGGLVNKLTFSRNLLWTNYSMETDCLLDGTAGQILALHVLPPFASVNPLVRPDELAMVFKNLTLIALSSERSSFAVAVDPKVHVLHRWARPSIDKTETVEHVADLPSSLIYLPCLSWGWALVSGGRNVVMPILARSWGCCLQFLCASFPTLDDDGNGGGGGGETGVVEALHWPAFGVREEIDTIAPVVALEWLNDRSLVYLTITNEFTLVDTVMMTLLERLDFSGLKLVYAEFALSRDNDASLATTFQNSVRSSDDRLMVLCRDELRCIAVVSAKRRISSLEEDGEWLEALALALDHYESTVVSQEDRRRDQTGRKDLSRHPEFSAAKSEEEEWIAKLLTRYINLAVDNAPIAGPSSPPHRAQHHRIDLAQSHFQMLAGVCVEFCVIIRRLDLLFGPIFRRFQAVGYTTVFLDVLEPYVLSDKLAYIAPEVMSYFVEHCKATNGIATVERCLLHMDCTIMDFDTILSLLRANEMYSALFYVFNQGLDDYVTPLEILLERIFDEVDAGSATKPRRKDGVLQTTFEKLGYKAILYLQTCFHGRTFPKEKDLLPEERKVTVKRELVHFLTRENFRPSPQLRRGGDRTSVVGQRALVYPYLRILLMVDPRIVLETLSVAFDSMEGVMVPSRTATSDEWTEEKSSSAASELPDIQDVMEVLTSIVLPTSGGLESLALQAPSLVNAFLDFTAKYLTNGAVHVNEEIVFMIMRRMSDRFAAAKDHIHKQQAQRQIMDLLSALPRDSYEPDKVLQLIELPGIHRAALLLHQQVASSWHEDGSRDIELRSRHFRSAIDCYVEDDDEEFRKEVFDYVKKECSGVADRSFEGGKPTSLRDALFTKLPALVQLDSLRTAKLVAELFVDDLDPVTAALESHGDKGKALFLFYEAIISGELVQVDPVAGSVLNLTMEHHHQYLSLMARLHPEKMYDYLSTHDNYRPEECLKLCQEYDIADASAYLLERLGNVSSALQLILQTLESRMMNLKRTIRGMGVEIFRQHCSRHALHTRRSGGVSADLPFSQAQDINRVKRILVVALDLCERNSGSLSSRTEHGSQLWFNVLDRLINAKGFLRLSKEQPEHAKIMSGVLSELLQLTMQRMVSSVPLTDLVRKVTSDHSGSRLGELREMVQSLLETYGFEVKVFEGAITVFHRNVLDMRKECRRLRLLASPVQSVMTVPLKADQAEGASGFLRRSSRLDVALKVGSSGNAALVDSDGFAQSRRGEGGLSSVLSKLRSRRSGSTAVSGGAAQSAAARTGLNMMAINEQLYQQGETDPVVFGPRPVGVLGTAEHRGRLVTFR